MTWPEVRAALDGGRDTVIVPFGAVEQHGRHLPLGTDALFGDEAGRRVAERLDAFVAPTVRIGCSWHHLEFAGTLSLEDETFHAVVADLVRSLARHGFGRIVLLPTHGGNFAPLGAAVERLGPIEGVNVIAISDLSVLIEAAFGVGAELGVSPERGGAHGGEWETSMVLALRPELVHMDRAEPGYVGDFQEGVATFFEKGAHAIDPNGVFGDPRGATPEAGAKYLDRLTELVVRAIDERS